LGTSIHLNEETLGGHLKAGISQYLSLEMTKNNGSDHRAITKYLPWLYSLPSLQQGYQKLHSFLFSVYTVDPVYSERGYSEYPIIVNGFLRTDRSFIVKLNTFIVNTGASEHFLLHFLLFVHYKRDRLYYFM
jgi:hypothetical protein